MRRRTWHLVVLMNGVLLTAKPGVTPARGEVIPMNETFVLARDGCGRATGYAETNKIITLDGKTHVTWLDSVTEGFRVRIRTLVHATGEWSPTTTVGNAHDNHGGPALAVDSKGVLHIVYFPHHHPFRYRHSLHPNDATEWSEETLIGERCTYPTLMVGPDDTLYLTGRVSNKEGKPWVVHLFVKHPGQPWSAPRAIMVAKGPGYSHYQAAMAWGPDHRTLHLSTRMYGGKPGRPHTVGYMRSADFGSTWVGAKGEALALPVSPAAITALAREGSGPKSNFRCGSIAIDREGTPHILYSGAADKRLRAWLAALGPDGNWKEIDLLPHVAKVYPDHEIAMPGGLVFNEEGTLFITLTLLPPEGRKAGGSRSWGHATNEVIWLESGNGGKTVDLRAVSRSDPTCANWLPNIEKRTGFNRVERPGLIFTGGTAGKSNLQHVSNPVIWSR